MTSGRRPMGAERVAKLEGSEHAKERLRAVLETIAGETTVEDACRRLGISRSRFHALRADVLQSALDRLAPRAPGRPAKRTEAEDDELDLLRRDNGWLREELEIARTRTEIALVMPHILRDPVSVPPSEAGKRRARPGESRSTAPRGGTTRDSGG